MATVAIEEIEELIMVQEEQNEEGMHIDGTTFGQVTSSMAEARLEFCCKYYDKKFYNKQALGGHQNAHRMERAMEKYAKRGCVSANTNSGGFMDYDFPGQANGPLMPYFLPGQPIPAPEIPVRHPYTYHNVLPNSPASIFNCNPMNNQEINNGELNLTLKL